MDVRRLRGRRDPELHERVHSVVRGENTSERNPVVLSMAADVFLSPFLRASRTADKGDILSWKQVLRRKQREVYLGDKMSMVDARGFVPHTASRRRVDSIENEG
jgi:hypothetical protein